ncbi:MAG: sigma-70 family RNA polymerase sigma factor [Planctomycetaceae bacterium]|nr:sigma-70 family RNA polymerase sigma factor [Planctomycetaceae bacterium]
MPLTPDELGRLLDQYWGTLVAWVGWEHAFAEDVVQAAFIKLAAQSPPPLNCPAWLFQVSRRLALNELKATQRRRQREQIANAQRQATRWPPSSLDAEELRATLERLEPQARQIVVARIWGELTFEQIATAVELPKATVWRMYQSAIEQLRCHYEQELEK